MLVRFSNYFLNLLSVFQRGKHFNIFPKRQDEGFQLVVRNDVNLNYTIVEIDHTLRTMESTYGNLCSEN